MVEVQEVITQIDRILVEQFELEPDVVVPGARLREELDLDSLDGADLMIAIEKKFKIRLDETVAREFRTVDDIHRYVRRLVDERAGATASA